MASSTGDRIRSLDITRGVAVMGIFSVNVVGMAMIQIAYFYPPAFGFDGQADRLMWLANFILIDGKLRALFSIMFGASTMLIIDRAVAAGRSAWRTHYARMAVLLGFGLAHFFLLWWGDILTHYAAVGTVAFLFARLSAERLLAIAAVGFLLFAAPSAVVSANRLSQAAAAAAPEANADAVTRWNESRKPFFPDAATIAADRADHASITAHVRSSVREGVFTPFDLGSLWIETLSLMLLGMAGYKAGFLTGNWSDRSYRRVAAIGIGTGLLVYAAFGWWTWASDFALAVSRAAYGGFTPLFRPVMATGYAALAILATRRRSAVGDRLAAVGRMAFTNYLMCTVIGVFVFYGFGGDLYAQVSRGEAWLLVPPVWLLMLAWSKPWLDRFHYGPFEWAWRSLARGRAQPMRKRG
ncbi:MAG TPA: DUF418 domain-containing protein [Sphingomicrobium sp.]|nr:DUF418 domain-containing protein [Sphingomicrobium sp.]